MSYSEKIYLYLKDLRQKKVVFNVKNGKIKWQDPDRVINKKVIGFMKAHKTEMLKYLTETDHLVTEPPEADGITVYLDMSRF